MFKRFMIILENLWQSSETFRKLRKQFKVFSRCFCGFSKFSENLRISSEVFENTRKYSENLRKRFKSNFQMILLFFKIFGKSSEIFGSVRKSSEKFLTLSGMFVMVRRS